MSDHPGSETRVSCPLISTGPPSPQSVESPVEPSGHLALGRILRGWGRIGCLGFGGPPAHIAMLREMCVVRERWIDEREFEHAISVTNLLPGPASTQLAIYCAWRLRGLAGAMVGGLAFILPGLILIIALPRYSSARLRTG